MLSKTGIDGLGKFFQCTWLMKSLPFVWDSTSQLLAIKYNSWSMLVWLFLAAVEALNGFRSMLDFLYCVIFLDSGKDGISYMLLALHLTFASGQLLGVLFISNLLCKLDDNIQCYNQLLRVNSNIWNEFRKEKARIEL
ncbi:unnamed protein product [Allacma fusca]|uniref:Uncharacterized protein n=1 Tax=Allacma fusca TaxID=39272 RepID=A0A8J2P1J5_9HEXA|nr:unnamed protein product [Allacma fusca]